MKKALTILKDFRFVITLTIAVVGGVNAYLTVRDGQTRAGLISKDYFEQYMNTANREMMNTAVLINHKSQRELVRDIRTHNIALVDSAAYPYIFELHSLRLQMDRLERSVKKTQRMVAPLQKPSAEERLLMDKVDSLAKERDQLLQFQEVMLELDDIKYQIGKLEYKPNGDKVK